jgi:hypothetical protein
MILKTNEAAISALKRLLPNKTQARRKSALLMTVISKIEGTAGGL